MRYYLGNVTFVIASTPCPDVACASAETAAVTASAFSEAIPKLRLGDCFVAKSAPRNDKPGM
jgi:hypothetical protein